MMDCRPDKITFETAKNAWGEAKILFRATQIRDNVEIGIFTCEAGKSLDMHTHGASAERCYILEGNAVFECDGRKFTAGPGEYVYLPANSQHLSYPADDKPFTSMYIVCSDQDALA